MKISTKSEYGIRALIHLAECGNGQPYSIQLIAKNEKLPYSFLEKIFQKLKNAGIVESVRGVSGGYKLNKPLDQINVKSIFDVLDDGVEIFGRLAKTNVGDGIHCKSHVLFTVVDKSIQDSLQRLSLADIIK